MSKRPPSGHGHPPSSRSTPPSRATPRSTRTPIARHPPPGPGKNPTPPSQKVARPTVPPPPREPIVLPAPRAYGRVPPADAPQRGRIAPPAPDGAPRPAGLRAWLDSRTGYRATLQKVLDQPVRGGASWVRVFGPMLVFLLINQALTGVLLASFYAPSATTAWASVAYIQDQSGSAG